MKSRDKLWDTTENRMGCKLLGKDGKVTGDMDPEMAKLTIAIFHI